MGEVGPDVDIVVADPSHRSRILELLSTTLGWGDDPRYEEFFRWKHERNPFGESPAWIAVADGDVVGLRTFLRWEFERDGARLHAVRAVDTATRPDIQGRGVFRRLTLAAVDKLRAESVDFVFNTPNEQSRPGYLKMGWEVVGRLPTLVRPTSIGAFGRILRARRPAERWSLPCTAGAPAAEMLADAGPVDDLLAAAPSDSGLHTRRSTDYLRWRYGWEGLGYRALTVSADPAEGLAFFRLRRRGDATEAALCELIVPDTDRRVARRLIREVARTADADYVIALHAPIPRSGMATIPGVGPTLTWRPLARNNAPPRREWQLTLGDVELF